MAGKNYMIRVNEVMEDMDCSKAKAYRIIARMNAELAAKGYEVHAGRVPRPYYAEKLYGYEMATN